MSFITRNIIAPLFPGWALRRMRAEHLVQALYEVAEPSRLRKVREGTRSARQSLERAGVPLRGLARHLEENHDISKGALDTLVAGVVGKGIQPEPQVRLKDGSPATETNKALLRLLEDWARVPEVTWEMDYWTVQRMAARTWLRDGEVLTQLLSGPVVGLDHGTMVPFSLELLEPDYLPYSHNSDEPRIINGVELNAWGRPRAYHVAKEHPGDGRSAAINLKRIPAENVLHVKYSTRLHQVRGVSVFASVLARMDDIKEIDESERVAARVAAAMAAFIKKGVPADYEPTSIDGTGKPELRQLEWVPGMIFDDLLPGEDIGTIASNRPNNALIPFRDSQLRAAAAGIGSSFSSLARNYDGTYSAQRQELVESRLHYEVLASHFIRRFCEPVWRRFVTSAAASGLLPREANVDPETLGNASHTMPPLPWIDPVKEAEANGMLEDRGYKSRTEIIRERGRRPDEVNQEFLQDQQEREELGLEFGQQAAGPGPAQAPESDPPPPPENPDEPAARTRAPRQRSARKRS